MRINDYAEKRRFKRLNLSLPMRIKSISSDGKEKVQEGVTINVSFNGAYVIDINSLNLSDRLNISLCIPRDDTRDFPFSRIVGKARAVRVDPDGVALEFSDDIKRLFVVSNG